MKTSKSEYIRMLRVQFERAEKDGLPLDYKLIDKYLEDVQKLAETDTMFDAVAVAQITSEQTSTVAQQDRKAQGDLEMFKAVISTSAEAYKASLLINGGAAVALLALVGHSLSSPGGRASGLTDGLAGPLLYFVAGVLLAAVTSGVAYLTQRLYQVNSAKTEKAANVCNLIAVALMGLSYAAFVVGCLGAYRVFTAVVHL